MTYRVVTRAIDYTSRTDIFKIALLFDIHLGSRYCNERLLRDTISSIKRAKNTYWIGGGDYCEWITRRDPRAQESELVSWLWGEDDLAGAQKTRLQELLKPIAPKCLGLIEGNHEVTIKRHTERDVYQGLVDSLLDGRTRAGVKAAIGLGPNGFIKVIFRRRAGEDKTHGSSWTCVIYATHGSVGGRKAGAKALRLQDIHRTVEADIVMMGHSHEAVVLPTQMRLRAGATNQAISREVHLVSAGSFLGTDERGWPEYAARKDYPPNAAAVVEAIIQPDKEKIRIIA